MLLLLFFLPLFFSCPIPHCKSCSSDNELCLECNPDFIYQRDDQACIYIQPCPPGTFKTKNLAALCQQCDASCEYCWGPSNNQCYFCSKGFFFESLFTNINNQKCVTCPSSHCQECDPEGVCEKCQPGFYLTQNNECQKCGAENCEYCPDDKCDRCKTGYISDQNKCEVNSTCVVSTYFEEKEQKCLSCASECFLCFGASDTDCFECKEGYYFDSNNKCIACDASCKGCDDGASYCVSCPKGKVLRGHDCVANCQDDEYFDNIDFKCKECEGKCGKCIDKREKCTQCFDEVFYNFDPKNNTCDKQCPDGQFPKLNSLMEDKFYLDSFYKEFWDLKNLTNIVIKRNFTCVPCVPMCKTCYIHDNVCTSCSSGLFLMNHNCLPGCPKGYFTTFDAKQQTGICQACQYPCANCTDLNTCVQCYSPFYLENTTCIYKEEKVGKCEDWEFQAGVLCREECPKGSDPIGNVCFCDSSCTTCTISVASNSALCLKCINRSLFSYNGICIGKCPNTTWSYYNYCYDQCPTPLLSLISNNEFKCVPTCPYPYVKYQSYCLLNGCPEGSFFNSSKLTENPPNAANTSDTILSQICQKCDASCQTCSGSNQTQCLVCAKDFNLQPSVHLDYQMIMNIYNILNSTAIIANIQGRILDIYKTNGTVCSKECPKGFISMNKICMLCIQNCEVCEENLYLLNNNCYTDCPRLTEKDDINDECVSSFDYAIEIPTISNYVGYGKDLLGRIKLDLFNQNNVVNKVECHLIKGQLIKEIAINFSDTLRVFDLLIGSALLEKGSAYSLECSVSSSFITKQKKFEFNTFDLLEGVFEISPQIGYSLLDSITIKFEKWMVTGVSSYRPPLNYKIILFDGENSVNENLFFGSDVPNLAGLLQPLSKTVVKKLSKSMFNSTLQISLEITNENLKTYVLSRNFEMMSNFSIKKGVFDVPLRKGFALKENYTISVKNFYAIQNVLDKEMIIDYPLNYRINMIDSEIKSNQTFIKVPESKDYSKIFNLRFPYVEKNKTIILELQVYNDLSFYSASIELEIFFFYKQVDLPKYYDLPIKTCGPLQSIVDNKICFDKCPSASISIENTCYCDENCLSCVLSETIQCEKCKNTLEYSYKGLCYGICPISTWKTKNNELDQNYCYAKCTEMHIITTNSEYYCGNSCPYGFEFLNNYCFEKKCPSSDYSFSQKNIDNRNVSSSASYVDNFCIKCHQTCEECFGVSESSCLSCKENLFFYRSKCYSACPVLTIPDPNNPVACRATFYYEINIEKDDYLSFINDLKGDITIYQEEIFQISFDCSLMLGSDKIYQISLTNPTLGKYTFIVPERYLDNERKYMIKCIAQRQSLSIENSTEFNTPSLPQGTFEVSANSGYEIKDSIKIQISDWAIKEDLEKRDPFTYYLYIINKETNKNISFYIEQESTNKNLSKSLDYNLPHVLQNSTLILLQVNIYNLLTFITKTIEIKVFTYFTKVTLSSDVVIIPKTCENYEYNIAGVCKSSCPFPSIALEKICFCPEKCATCIFSNLTSIDCKNCRNSEEFSFKGDCLNKCPASTWINPKDQFKSQFCSEKCEKVSFVNQTGFYCLDKCLYESYNNICFEKDCPDGYLFTMKNLESSSFSVTNSDFLTFFCEKCDNSCQDCFGKGSNQCSSCRVGSYLYRGQCNFNCPDGTIVNPFNPLNCLSSSNYKIIFDSSFSGFVSFIKDLVGEISIVDEEANQASIKCQIFLFSHFVDLPIDRNNKNRFRISKDELKPSSNYNISCIMQVDSKMSVSSIEFKTVSLPQGNFQISPASGFALRDFIKISIYNWVLSEDFTHKLPLHHIIYSKSQLEGNRTIFNETSYENLIRNLQYPFPYVDYNQTIQYELQVFNEFTFGSTVIEAKDFLFYKRVILSQLNNTKPPKNCESDDFKIEDQCLDECPFSTFAIDGICYCDQSCQKCSFYRDLGKMECEACKDSSHHNYKGTCLQYCPSRTWVKNISNFYSSCEDCDRICGECYGPSDNNCVSCKEYMFFFKDKCFLECPLYTTSDFDYRRICKAMFYLEMNLKLIKNYASYITDLEGTIQIPQNINDVKLSKITCYLYKMNKEYSDYEFELEYSTLGTNFVINHSLLLPLTKYYLKCKPESDLELFGAAQEFSTFSEPYGYFDINPKKVTSLKENITIEIKEFLLKEDPEKELTLVYSILLTDSCNNRSFPVFEEKSVISKSFEYVLPAFEKDCQVDFQLTVFNDFVKSTQNIGVVVLKKQVQMDDIANAANETTKSATDYISKNYSNALQESTCDPKVDCSENGVCKETYLNDGIKCNCFTLYKGIFCQWKKEDFEKIYQAVNQQIEDLTKLSQSNTTEALNILNSLGSIVDIYNTSLYKKSLDLIEGLSNNVNNPDDSKTMVETLDKFVNILSFLKNDFNEDYLQKNITSQINNVLDSVINSISSTLKDDPISIISENIKIKLQSFNDASLGRRLLQVPSTEITNGVDVFKLSFFNLKSLISEQSKDLYLSTSILNSNAFSIAQSEESMVTDIIEIQIKKRKTNEKLDLISDFSILRVLFQIKSPLTSKTTENYKYECRYFDAIRKVWSKEGLTTQCEDLKVCECFSNRISQLTIFKTPLTLFDLPIVGPNRDNNISDKFSIIIFYTSTFIFILIIMLYYEKSKDKFETTSELDHTDSNIEIEMQSANKNINQGKDQKKLIK